MTQNKAFQFQNGIVKCKLTGLIGPPITKMILEFQREELWSDAWLPNNVFRFKTLPDNEIMEVDLAIPTPNIIGTATPYHRAYQQGVQQLSWESPSSPRWELVKRIVGETSIFTDSSFHKGEFSIPVAIVIGADKNETHTT